MRDLELALKAAGDPTRTRILKLLEAADLCVCQIQAVLALAPSTVSKHLTGLKLAGFVEDRRDGKWVYYTLAAGQGNPYAAGILLLLKGRLDRDPRVRADRRRLRQVLALPADELCNLPPAPDPVSARFRSSSRRRREAQHV
jgi:arsenate reductase/ArsR family transcriptional regulator